MPKSTRTDKILFIVNHPDLLKVPQLELANALKSAGLVSSSTSPVDLHPRRLQEEARKVIAKQAAGTEGDATFVPFTTADACWCQPFDGPMHPNCPMHGTEGDAMARVRAVYPSDQARIIEEGDTFGVFIGQRNPTCMGRFIGSGSTPDAAWADAAKRLGTR